MKHALAVLAFFGAALLGAIGSASAQTGPIYCNLSLSSALPLTTLTTVIPAPSSGSAKLYVCGYLVSAVAAANVTFSYGTGTNCGTTNTAFGSTIQLGANATVIDSSPAFRGFLVPPAGVALAQQNLCATASAAANITVYYAQQ